MASISDRANQWICGSDTGSSSKCLWAVMMGATPDRWKSHPHDGSDLGRCLRLLALIPEWRPRIGEMASVSPYWAVLVENWAKLEAAAISDPSGIYKMMRGLLDPIEKADRNVVRFGSGGVTMKF